MASNESEDGSASMEASDRDCDVNCSNGSAPMNKPKRTKSGTMFRAWSFHVTLKANVSHGATTRDKIRLLSDHLRSRTAHCINTSFTSVSTFCDESLLSGPTDSEGLVSIVIQGYVQTREATPISTMHKFIDTATWKPVPGGLAGDAEFRANSASLAKLYAFGEIGLNNQGRSEKSQEQKRAKQVQPIPIIESFSLLPLLFSYYALYSALLSKSFCGA